MIFDPPSQALEFLRAGGTVSLTEWREMSPADRAALLAARHALEAGPKIEAQIRAEGDQLAAAFRGVARALQE